MNGALPFLSLSTEAFCDKFIKHINISPINGAVTESACFLIDICIPTVVNGEIQVLGN